MDGRAAVLRAASTYFRSRYVGRDSSMPIAQVKNPDGSPVSSDLIEVVASEWDDEATQLEDASGVYKSEVVSG